MIHRVREKVARLVEAAQEIGAKKVEVESRAVDRVDDRPGTSQVDLQNEATPPSLPPPGAGVATPEAMNEAAAGLALAGGSDPELQQIVADASSALRESSEQSALRSLPRFWVSGREAHPEKMIGRVHRSEKSDRDGQRTRVFFVPDDPSIPKFPIDRRIVDGVASGATIELRRDAVKNGQESYRVKIDEAAKATSFVATVVKRPDGYYAVGVRENPVYEALRLGDPNAAALVGQRIVADVVSGTKKSAKVREVVGDKSAIENELLAIASAAGAAVGFSSAAMAEVEKIEKTPLEGKDLRHIPFITVDNDTSKDLDQAMHIERRTDGGYEVSYAIADVPYYVREDGAIDREAKGRGTTIYLPGRNIPMLPPELSEGLISLLPNQDRRAIVVKVSLDKEGNVVGRSFDRGIIRSRAQLTYKEAQAFHDQKGKTGLSQKEYTPTLELFKEVGELRKAKALERGAIEGAYGRAELDLREGEIVTKGGKRLDSESWNEQLSILSNQAVADELAAQGVSAIFRSQRPGSEDRLEAFREITVEIGLPWKKPQPLSTYLGALDARDPRSSILRGLATRTTGGSKYETAPKPHAMLALDRYLQASAPMRRLVDLTNIRILADLIDGRTKSRDPKKLLALAKQTEIASSRERTIDDRCQILLAAHLFEQDIGKSFEGRVVQVRPSGLVVELAGSGLRVNVPPAGAELGACGAALGGAKLGDIVEVTPTSADPKAGIVAFGLSVGATGIPPEPTKRSPR
jgi:VacB/RNase II family 3'-5' exoribonuclease